jgi:hypothetical protein
MDRAAIEPIDPQPTGALSYRERITSALRATAFQPWHWLLVPLLAIIAYAPALSVGFLSDDWALLLRAKEAGIDPSALIPNPYWPSYRPFGVFVTWQLGWQLFGANPLPYHLLSLLLHASTALALALWAATVTSKHWLGWLAGVAFAVFPLHMEAVAWTAAQWDMWAALFGILSLMTFARWWRDPSRWGPYIASLVFFTLGIFSKESLLAFLPLLAVSAWLLEPPRLLRDWLKLAISLAPFAAVLFLNVFMRLAFLGRLGGYVETRADVGNFFWSNFAAFLRALLSPLAELTMGGPASQIVGAAASLLILSGLIFFGRDQRRFLIGALLWIVLAVVPVLNLPPNALDLQQNRLLYLPAAGYCAFLAALAYEAVRAADKWRPFALSAAALALIMGTAASWAQLAPWHTATLITEDIAARLSTLLPGRPMTLYVENLPDNYRGAYLFRVGLGGMRSVKTGQLAVLETVPSAQATNLAAAPADAFALRFGYDPFARRYRVAYAAGVTAAAEPPTAERIIAPEIWDYRACNSQDPGSWQAVNAQLQCRPGDGLLLAPTTSDPQLLSSLTYGLNAGTASFARVRVMAAYPPSPASPEPVISEWFWKGDGGSFSGDNRRSLPIRADGNPYIYWTYIPATDIGPTLTGLRFDPSNSQVPTTINWIALDTLP